MIHDYKSRVLDAFARRFRQALAEMGHSLNKQKLMRQLFGVSGQAVRKWADGQAMPTSSRIPQVARVLGVNRAWLQDGEGPMRPVVGKVTGEGDTYDTEAGRDLFLTSEEANLLSMYRRLDDEQRAAIRVIISSIAGLQTD